MSRDIFAMSIHDAFCVAKSMDFQAFWERIFETGRDVCIIFKSMNFEAILKRPKFNRRTSRRLWRRLWGG